MAGGRVSGPLVAEDGFFIMTSRHEPERGAVLILEVLLLRQRLRLGTAWVEATPRRWVDRGRNITFEDDPSLLLGEEGIGDGDRGQQRPRVGVPGASVQILALGGLDDLSQVHDR